VNRRIYKEFNEVIYSETLKNGLTVKIIPKREYSSVYTVLFADYGSNDHVIRLSGDSDAKTYPFGVAHFLEHKLFESEEGDISEVFSSQGASVNAFTSNTKTAFMCSFTRNMKKNIDTLLNFVQTPFFDDQSVEDEKNIITQEIQMYKDDPDWVSTQGLIENLYPNHPVRIDVAGTPDSVQQITTDMLRENHQTFYHPSNMQVIVVGNIDPEEASQWIFDNQVKKVYPAPFEIERKETEEKEESIIKNREVHLPVNLPKVSVGVKGHSLGLTENQAFHQMICMEIILDLLFGETSLTYLNLYNENLIDDSFSYEYVFERGFDYVSIGGDSRSPEELARRIKDVLANASASPDLTPEHFSLIQKKLTGEYIQDLNSLGYIAHQFVDMPLQTLSIFDYLEVLETITFEELKNISLNYFQAEHLSVFTVLPRLK